MIYKNTIQSILTLILILVTGITASAQELQLSVPDSSGMVGEEITLPVYISDTGVSDDIYSYELKMTYNSSRLLAKEVITDNSISGSFGTIASNLDNSGEIFIAAAGASPMDTDGTLLFIRFELISGGSANVGFNNNDTFFNEPGTVPASFDNGWISIEPLPSFNVFPINSTIFVGDELNMNLSSGTGPVTWSIVDESVATVDEGGIVTGVDYGITEIIAVDVNGVPNSNTAQVDVRNIRINYENHDIFQGNEVSIPVYLENPNDVEIFAGVVEATWSNNLISSYSINTSGTLLEGTSTEVNTENDKFELGFARSSPLPSGDLPLFYLEVVASDDNTGNTFSVNHAEFNEGNISLLDTGRLRVITLPNLFLSPNNPTLVAGETQQFSVSNTTGPVEWSVSDPAVATIDENGLLTTLTGGMLQVFVEDSIGASTSSNTFLVYDGWVTTPDTTFFSGSTSMLPVRIDEMPAGKSVQAYEMNLSYNSDRMTFAGVSTANTFSEGWSVAENQGNGSVTLASAGVSGFTGPGTIVYLVFDIEPGLSNTTASFNISNLMLNEGDPAVRLQTPNIQITNQLGTPTLISPANNATGVSIDGELEWEAVAGATHYQLQISDSNTFNTILIDEEDLDQITFTYSLEHSSTYYWRVKAFMNQNESSWSSTFSFSTEEPVPGNVDLQSPADQATNIPVVTDFEWNTASDADLYEIQISESADFDPLTFDQVTDQTSLTVDDLAYSTNYNWRVRALNSNQTGEWSDIWSFTTTDPQPGQVLLSTPDDGATGLDTDVLFTWFPDENAVQYRIQISEDNTFSPASVEETLTDTSLTVTDLSTDTEFNWRVRAEFDDTNFGDWSEIWTFTTLPDLPGTVTLTYPVDETIQDEDTIEFQWQEVDGAGLYQIDVSETDDFSDILFSEELDETAQTFSGFEEKTYYWRVRAGNSAGWGAYSSSTFEVEMSTSSESLSEIPAELKLYQNYPNPFNPSSIIRFDLPGSERVKIEVYNTIGQQVAVITDQVYQAGKHQVSFDGSSLTSGIYIYRLTISDQALTRSMTLIK